MVATVDFSLRGTKALVYKDITELTELIAGERYQLPEPCIPSTLSVFLNQGTLDRTSPNGFNVVSSTVFELKEPLAGLGTVHAFFVSYQPE